jgi:putative phosphoesterase
MKLLILSDIHANWPALEAVLKAETGVEHIICAGDLVNYGPHPVQCVEWMRAHSGQLWIVQGNHDRALGMAGNPQCSKPFRKMAAEGKRFTALQLDAEQKKYLLSLPKLITQQVTNRRITVCHAVPSMTPYAYVAADAVARWRFEVAFAQHPDFLVVGHTHLPFVIEIDGTTIINPGSVGQPKDGDPRASYAVWENGKVELRRAAYDVQTVVDDLFTSGISSMIARQLANVLQTGGATLP